MSVRIYPDVVMAQDLSPEHGGSRVDELCEEIHDATKGKKILVITLFERGWISGYPLTVTVCPFLSLSLFARISGWGANKQKVIDAIATQDATTRYYMSIRYPELYEGKTLVKLMSKEFSGDFGTCLEFLSLPSNEAECAMIRKATKVSID